MKITKQELIELNACESGLNRFIAQTDNTDEPVEVSTLIGGKNRYSDLIWLAGKKLPKERIARFACNCALLNIELIKPYTDKYDDVVEFLRNPTRDSARARDAAEAAYFAATAAAPSAAAAAATAAAAAATAAAAAATADTADTAATAYTAAFANKGKVNELLRELFRD